MFIALLHSTLTESLQIANHSKTQRINLKIVKPVDLVSQTTLQGMISNQVVKN